MSIGKRLALIAAGYALAVAGAIAAVAVNEWLMPADIAETSPGMVAFGEMILFVLAAGGLGLAPTSFLLRLLVDTAPRALLAAELVMAALGPASWLTLLYMAGGAGATGSPTAAAQLLGLFIAFGAIPRIVVGPVLVVIEAATFVLLHARTPGCGDADGRRPVRPVRAAYGGTLARALVEARVPAVSDLGS